MALNAGVKSSKLGKQRKTFAVMAQEITSLARQSQAFVTDIEAILESVATLNSSSILMAQSYKKGQGNYAEQTAPEQAGAIKMLNDRIQTVSDSFDQFKIKSSEAHKLVGILREKIARVKTGLSFLPALANELMSCKHLTELISQIVKDWTRQGRELTSAEIETIVRQCKTQSKQNFHRLPDRHKDHVILPETDALPPTPNFSTEDDLGNNVELF